MAPGKSSKAVKAAEAKAADAAAPETDVVDDGKFKAYPKSLYKGDLHGKHEELIVANAKEEAAGVKRGFKDQTDA